MAAVRISSEFSAQPSTSRPNAFVEKATSWIEANSPLRPRQRTCANQGCGKLRHYRLLSKRFSKLLLVDTNEQLNITQRIWEINRTSIREYVKRLDSAANRVAVMSSEDFAQAKCEIDVIFNVCVVDVVVPRIRKCILAAAYRNLKIGGFFVLIVPRNDQTITVRCERTNRFLDGHFFHHHGVSTFYRDFRNTTDLMRLVKRAGFAVREDLSVYRQACLICRK